MNKLKYLYHASCKKDLKLIKPRLETAPQDFNEGPVVFATDSFSFATQFIVPTDDSWANGGAFGDTFFYVISDRRRYEEADSGGCVYLISSKGFNNYNKREWFSRKSYKPKSKVIFEFGLEAMIINGVQVYFVEKDLYKEIQGSADHGMSILNKLKSENEKWGLKVKKLDMYRGSKLKVNI